MSRVTVSIVTPCWNAADVIEQCVANVRAQTHVAIEHVVVDGASTDGTVELLRRSAPDRWVSEPDHGQSDALRKGFAMATGEVLTWLCADDELAPDAIERGLRRLVDTSADFVFGTVEIVAGRATALLPPPAALDRGSFAWANPISQPGTLFTRAAYEAVGGIDETIDFGMDHNLWVRLVAAGFRGVRVDQVLARYHVDPTSKTGKVSPARFLLDEADTFAAVSWHPERLIALGRRAGYLSLAPQVGSLEAAVDRVVTESGVRAEDRASLRAIARTEVARHRVSVHASPWSALAAPGPWRSGYTRREALRILRRHLRQRRSGTTEPTVEEVIQAAGGDRLARLA